MKRSKRFEKLEKQPINMDSFFVQWPEGGLSAMESPYDPKPSLVIEDDIVVEMDGKKAEAFDSIDLYISKYAINLDLANEAMAIPSEDIARMIVDINVKRETLIAITTAITPAKMLEVLKHLNAVEIMLGQMKMRRRRRPANQAAVTNILDNPALLAADAAEAASRGFSELETTCSVSRYAPFNAMAIMIGGLTSRPGVLTQCAMEESMEVKMGMLGITSYAETVSFYGTEKSMDDGYDTVWSKGFLSAIYASRGIKMRCTSGTGAEVLLGHAEQKSMLYLELRCIYMAKGCGIQGIQNGSISCIGITTSVPEGFLAIAAENLAVSLLDMEVASGNDQTFTHSDIRKTAKLLMQMLPGTDFITSGYSAVPNLDDVFAGSNTDCDDYDDYYMMQRDLQVDGGIEPITEEEAIKVRTKAAKACQCVFAELGFPQITDEEVMAAVYAYSNEEMPPRNMAKDLNATQDFWDKGFTALDVVKALYKNGFRDIAENVLGMLKARVAGDYLQVSAIFDEAFHVVSGLNDANDYSGPGTGYRLEGERWKKLSKKESAIVPEEILQVQKESMGKHGLYRLRQAGSAGPEEADLVVGISPGFLDFKLGADVCKLHHRILLSLVEGIRENNLDVKIVKFYDTTDLGEMARICATLSRSKMGMAIQIKGKVYLNDARREASETMKGFFNMTLSSPEQYKKIGTIVSRCVLNQDISELEPVHAGSVTEYQLKMMKLAVDEDSFLKKYKKPEWVVITEDY